MNRRRSLTAERMFRTDARVEVRSAGLSPEARRRVSECDVRWADLILVMENGHKARLKQQFGSRELPLVTVLDIPDDFEYMDPDLQAILMSLVESEIVALVGGDGGEE